MSKVFSLESMREELEKKYATLEVALENGEVVELPNILRMKKKQRLETQRQIDAVVAVQQDDNASLQDVVDASLTLLVVIAGPKGQKLKAAIAEEADLVLHLIELWMGTTQAGEA